MSRRFVRAAALALAAIGALLAPDPATAFDCVPGDAPHAAITAEAARRAGWDRALGGRLARRVCAVDWEDARWAPAWSHPLRIAASPRYRPEHHFDRPPDSTSRAAFDAGRRALRHEIARARALADAGDGPGALTALARALHALQDLHAHSNLVDLDAATRRAVYAALEDTSAAIPGGLRLTSYAGWPYGAAGPPPDPADPPGDRERYSHRLHAKDRARANPESAGPAGSDACGDGPGRTTRFGCACALATEASTRLLREFAGGLDPAALRALGR